MKSRPVRILCEILQYCCWQVSFLSGCWTLYILYAASGVVRGTGCSYRLFIRQCHSGFILSLVITCVWSCWVKIPVRFDQLIMSPHDTRDILDIDASYVKIAGMSRKLTGKVKTSQNIQIFGMLRTSRACLQLMECVFYLFLICHFHVAIWVTLLTHT